jgi:hypothetical protein
VIFAVSPQIANAVVATATVTLAVAAFWAIWQNYSFQRQEKKERLIDEIIKWAEDIIIYSLRGGVFDIVTLSQGLNADLLVDTHGQSPWHFTGQASLDLNPGPLAISHTR